MTEAEWLACSDIQAMIDFVTRLHNRIRPPTAEQPHRDRALRLFAVGCCRRRWELFLDPEGRAAVETAERFADGLASREELRQAGTRAREREHRIFEDRIRDGRMIPGPDRHIRYASLFAASEACGDPVARAAWEQLEGRRASNRIASPWWFYSVNGVYRIIEFVQGESCDVHCAPEQADILRCVVGNPFRSVKLRPAWRTSTVHGLAEAIYAERAFDRLPILADALEDAGCDNADILAHCRGDGPHVRGCWVVDLILGKE